MRLVELWGALPRWGRLLVVLYAVNTGVWLLAVGAKSLLVAFGGGK